MTAAPQLSAPARLTPLEAAVIEAVVYSDVFDFPVTAEEILCALPVSAGLGNVEAALAPGQPLARLLSHEPPYYVLRGREHLVALRADRHAASRNLWRHALRYGRLIARLPFVRLVAVSGSLAVDNAPAGDDVDYLIVTRPGRVWLARALTMAVVRLAALRGVTLCPNFVLAEDALALPDRDTYTARELVQMQAIAGAGACAAMLAQNAWYHNLLPNATPAASAAAALPSSPLRRGLEALLGGRLGDALERRLMRRKARELRHEAGDNDEAIFDATMCKGHSQGHRRRTAAAVAQRLATLIAANPVATKHPVAEAFQSRRHTPEVAAPFDAVEAPR